MNFFWKNAGDEARISHHMTAFQTLSLEDAFGHRLQQLVKQISDGVLPGKDAVALLNSFSKNVANESSAYIAACTKFSGLITLFVQATHTEIEGIYHQWWTEAKDWGCREALEADVATNGFAACALVVHLVW